MSNLDFYYNRFRRSMVVWFGVGLVSACNVPIENFHEPDASPGSTAPGVDAPTDAVLNGLAQQAYLKASNTGAGDYLGYSVSLSGDTLAIGAHNESSAATGVNGDEADNSAVGSGAVYVFVRNGAAWTQQAYLKASNTEAGDFFGFQVSLSGDTLAVGAWRESSGAAGVNGNQADNSVFHAGAVYVFVRSGATWTQQAYLKASNPGVEDGFGTSLSLSGDTLAVGAFQESSAATGVNGNQTDNSAMNAGAVYVFVRSGTTWTQQAYLKASNTGAGDNFGGSSVSLSGDTLAVGAYGESSAATGVNGDQADNSASNAGAAYVFVRSGTMWTQQAYLKASNTGVNDSFGSSISLSGDTLAVGAVKESSATTGVDGNQADNSASNSGAVYVFVRSGTTWTQQAYLKASNTGTNDFFGVVSLFGDTLAVGAYQEASAATGVNGNQIDNSASDSGAVYVFVRRGAAWTQQEYLKASNTGAGDNFGLSVSLSGDALAVTAYRESSAASGANGDQADNSATWSGAAYVFR